jgi:lysophospholipase L1-like esterase
VSSKYWDNHCSSNRSNRYEPGVHEPDNFNKVNTTALRSDPNVEDITVAFLGSSSTAGKGQAFDWIAELKRRPENRRFRFHNFGVGGDLAFNALQRLPGVLACRPQIVVVWVGGNDVLALVSAKVRRFFRIFKRLPVEPSPSWFRENLEEMVHRLKAGGPIKVALCSLPPIGEDLWSENSFQSNLDQRIAEYSAIIKEVAQEEEDVGYVAMYEGIRAGIATSPGRAFTRFRFWSFYRDAFSVLVLRKSPDEIAFLNG